MKSQVLILLMLQLCFSLERTVPCFLKDEFSEDEPSPPNDDHQLFAFKSYSNLLLVPYSNSTEYGNEREDTIENDGKKNEEKEDGNELPDSLAGENVWTAEDQMDNPLSCFSGDGNVVDTVCGNDRDVHNEYVVREDKNTSGDDKEDGARDLASTFGERFWKDLPCDVVQDRETKLVLQQVDISGGVAGSTSTYPAHYADLAFVPQTKETFPWQSSGSSVELPQMVWYKFTRPIKPIRFAFSSRVDGWLSQSPSEFDIVGSHDCSDWTILKTEKTKFVRLGEEQGWWVNSSSPFACIGVRALKAHEGQKVAAIQGIKIWELKGDSPISSLNATATPGAIPPRVWFRLPEPMKVFHFWFPSSSSSSLSSSSSPPFVFVGSHDCENWTPLRKVCSSGAERLPWAVDPLRRPWAVPPKRAGTFSCYGFVILTKEEIDEKNFSETTFWVKL